MPTAAVGIGASESSRRPPAADQDGVDVELGELLGRVEVGIEGNDGVFDALQTFSCRGASQGECGGDVLRQMASHRL